MATFKKYKTRKGMLWRYQVCITDPMTGKKSFKSKSGFATKRDAKIAADELEKQIHTGGYSQADDITFSELADMWLESYQLTVRDSTFRVSETMLRKNILPVFGHKKVVNITTLDCQRVANKWSKEVVTFNKRVHLLQRILRYARNLQIIDRVPTEAVIMPRVKKADSSKNFYTREELQLFLEHAKRLFDVQTYTLFRLLAFSGLRKGEALALTWADIHFDDGYVDVTKTVAIGADCTPIIHEPKTKASTRRAYIDQKTMDTLKDWRALRAYYSLKSAQSESLVFSNKKNKPLEGTYLLQKIKIAASDAGLHRITLHGFRHTYATLAAQGGMPIKELQAQLGHADVQTTLNIYTSITDEQRQGTADQYTAFVNF